MLSSTVTIMYYASAALTKSSHLEGPFNFFSLPIKLICLETHLSQFDEQLLWDKNPIYGGKKSIL